MTQARRDIDKKLRETLKERGEESLWKTLKGGKRLRPILSLLCFHACQGKDYNKALSSAVVGELGHTASLIHDDIIDQDKKRRGKPTLYLMEGIPKAIILGHQLLTLGLSIALNQGLDIARTIVDAWEKTLKGEILDIKVVKEKVAELPLPAKQIYYNIIVNKTASLFRGAAQVGAQAADAPPNLQNIMAQYGEAVGIAYQIADDYVDLRKGAIEVLPIVALSQLEEGAKKTFTELLEYGRFDPITALSRLGFDAKTFFYNELDKTIEKAEQIAANPTIPETPYKPLLKQLPTYYVNAMFKEINEEYMSLKGF